MALTRLSSKAIRNLAIALSILLGTALILLVIIPLFGQSRKDKGVSPIKPPSPGPGLNFQSVEMTKMDTPPVECEYTTYPAERSEYKFSGAQGCIPSIKVKIDNWKQLSMDNRALGFKPIMDVVAPVSPGKYKGVSVGFDAGLKYYYWLISSQPYPIIIPLINGEQPEASELSFTETTDAFYLGHLSALDGETYYVRLNKPKGDFLIGASELSVLPYYLNTSFTPSSFKICNGCSPDTSENFAVRTVREQACHDLYNNCLQKYSPGKLFFPRPANSATQRMVDCKQFYNRCLYPPTGRRTPSMF